MVCTMSTQATAPPRRFENRLAHYATWLILFCGILLSLFAYRLAQQQEEERLRAAFVLTSERLASGLESRMKAHAYLLHGVAGLFGASDRIERHEFQAYVAALRIHSGYPGTQGLGYAPLIDPQQLAGHIKSVRQSGFPDYSVQPSGTRERYSAVLYLEPMDWRNRRGLGYDMYADPVRREAMDRAWQQGEAALSGKVTLMQETDEDEQPGTLLYVPVFRAEQHEIPGQPPQLLGWAFSPLRMRDLINGLLDSEFPELKTQLGLLIHDGSGSSRDSELYHSAQSPSVSLPYIHRQQITVAGRPWQLETYALPGFIDGHDGGRAELLLAAGLGITLLLTIGSGQLARHQRRLAFALDHLSATHEALKQSREELQTIYDASGAGMFMIDEEGIVVHANQRMAEMFRCPPERLLGSPYLVYVHTDEQEVARLNIAGLFEGRIHAVAQERRFLRADGHPFWGYLSSRPMPDRYGRIHRVVGVIVDTTDRHEAEAQLRQSEKRYRTLTETMLDVAWTADVETLRFTYCSPAVRHLRGYAPEEIVGQPLTLDMSPEVGESAVRLIRQRADTYRRGEIDSEHYFVDDVEQLRKDGSKVWTEVITNYYLDEAGHLTLRGVTRNIDERKRADDERRIAAVAFESHESMVVTDQRGCIIRVNHAFEQLNGFPASEAVGRTMRIVQSGRHDREFYRLMWEAIMSKGFWQGEIWNRRRDGELSPQWLTITAVLDARGQPTHYVGTAFDISQRLAEENEIRNLAFYDPLTGLANRRLLLDRLSHAFAKSSRSGKLGALIYIDLDRFKELNDRLGHAEGDRLLTFVADRLNTNVREGDTVARLGGDEFVILVEDLDGSAEDATQQATAVAEKLHAALNMPYPIQGIMPEDWRCTPSLGVALFADHRESSEALLQRADRALYAAKHAGRNTIRLAESYQVLEAARQQVE